MKKLFTLVLAVLACAAMCIPAMAVTPVDGIEHCYYNYICNKSVNTVTADGVYNEDEWSDAVTLVINKDTMENFGRWQCAGDPLPANEFSCTYKFKWDEKYFYVLEIRTDAHYVSNFEGNDYNALTPWFLDGTAIFFCDNEMPDPSNRCDIKFYSYVDELKAPSVYIGNGGEVADAFTAPSGEQDCTYGGSVNGDTVVFELKMPWQIMDDQWHLDSEIKEGTVFRFTPIIMSRDTIDDYNVWDEEGSSYRQINFHDCVNIPEEGVSGAEDPNYWAALTLSAAGAGVDAPAAPAFGVQDCTGSFDGEAAANMFDEDATNKWCFDYATYTEPYVIWNVENAINVTGYEIVTANDNAEYPGRNPGAWVLSGSNDGENWTAIATVEGDTVMQDANFTPFQFAADAAGEYSWFKFEIKNVVGGGVCQISAINLLSGEIAAVEAPVEEEAPAEEEVVEAAAPVEEEVVEAPAAPQTFDAAIIAAVAAVVSLAGYSVSKKH